MPAVAITDMNNVFATVKFFNAALKAGIKLDVGTEPEWHRQQQRELAEAKRSAAVSQEAGGNDADVNVADKNKDLCQKENANKNEVIGSSVTGPASTPMEVDVAAGSSEGVGSAMLPPPKSGSVVSSKQDL